MSFMDRHIDSPSPYSGRLKRTVSPWRCSKGERWVGHLSIGSYLRLKDDLVSTKTLSPMEHRCPHGRRCHPRHIDCTSSSCSQPACSLLEGWDCARSRRHLFIHALQDVDRCAALENILYSLFLFRVLSSVSHLTETLEYSLNLIIL